MGVSVIGVESLPKIEDGRAIFGLAVSLFTLIVAIGCGGTTASATPESTATNPPATATASPSRTAGPTSTKPPIATPTITPTPTPGITLHVAVTAANFRAGPGTQYGVLEVLPYNTAVTILGRTEDRAWFNVMTENGRRGWLGASVVYYADPAQSQQVETVATMPPPPATPAPPPTWTPGPGTPPAATAAPG